MGEKDPLRTVRTLAWLIVVASVSSSALSAMALLVMGNAVAYVAALGVSAIATGLLGVWQVQTRVMPAPLVPRAAEPAADSSTGLPISSVTGLYRSWVFRQRLAEEVARDDRFGHCFAVLLVEPADLLVVPSPVDYAEAARELQHCLRAGDFAAQYDDERFVVLMPETDREAAMAAGKSILLRLKKVTPSHASWRGAIVTYPDDAKTANDLLTSACDLLRPGRAEGAVRTAA